MNNSEFTMNLHDFISLISERAKATLVQIGPAVFQGGFSTFLAFVLLADSNSYGFALFFRVRNPADICPIVRKHNFVACKQRCRPACTFAQSDQHLHYLLYGKCYGSTCYQLNFNILDSP